MDTRFGMHNLHLEDITTFFEHDPQLRRLKKLQLIYRSPLIDQLPTQSGIFIVTGGRQVGKSTLLKLWMQKLLEDKTKPTDIAYLTGDIIQDYQELLLLTQNLFQEGTRILIIDEVTYIKEWDRAIKFLADAGIIEGKTLIITGSDSTILKEARLRFPGRKGYAEKHEFEALPLSFLDTIKLKNINLGDIQDALIEKLWLEYLQHGGYLTAINELSSNETISKSTIETYADWIRGDFIKHGKNENTLREVTQSLIKRQGSQVTWNALSKDLSIEHPMTLASYVELLASMNVVIVQSALDQNKLQAAPKKAKKIQFSDPFIFHALKSWLIKSSDPFSEVIKSALSDPESLSELCEAAAVSHINRVTEAFYIKSEQEIDITYITNKRIYPIEIKWTHQIRPKEIQALSKFENSQIWSRSKLDTINNIPNKFLPRALIEYVQSESTRQKDK